MLKYRWFLGKNAHFLRKTQNCSKKGSKSQILRNAFGKLFLVIFFIIYLKIGNFDFLTFPCDAKSLQTSSVNMTWFEVLVSRNWHFCKIPAAIRMVRSVCFWCHIKGECLSFLKKYRFRGSLFSQSCNKISLNCKK